jgi:hypothetical protein
MEERQKHLGKLIGIDFVQVYLYLLILLVFNINKILLLFLKAIFVFSNGGLYNILEFRQVAFSYLYFRI